MRNTVVKKRSEPALQDYARCITIHAPRGRVYDALASLDGVRGWWTPVVSGRATTGGELRVGFEGLGEDQEIIMRVSMRQHR